ncbi:MAG: hypothetical protein CL521_03935 [Actinobacteria bacterium]|nr:hypothetical protein [Actinomycetota bacterium]|tara:strand:+ start:92 stop:391 length:300 start_codon:yes stop_codon:yes gene_type:complete
MAKSFRHTVLFLVLLGVLLNVLCIGIRNVFRYNKFRSEYDQSVRQLQVASKLNQQYKRQLLQFQDNSYWELEAKRRLNYVKPGEAVYIFINQTSEAKSS